MNLDEEDCEDLAVKAFQLKLLRGRLDQGNERISTTYAIKREFGPEDWKNLKNKVSFQNQIMLNYLAELKTLRLCLARPLATEFRTSESKR